MATQPPPAQVRAARQTILNSGLQSSVGATPAEIVDNATLLSTVADLRAKLGRLEEGLLPKVPGIPRRSTAELAMSNFAEQMRRRAQTFSRTILGAAKAPITGRTLLG